MTNWRSWSLFGLAFFFTTQLGVLSMVVAGPKLQVTRPTFALSPASANSLTEFYRAIKALSGNPVLNGTEAALV